MPRKTKKSSEAEPAETQPVAEIIPPAPSEPAAESEELPQKRARKKRAKKAETESPSASAAAADAAAEPSGPRESSAAAEAAEAEQAAQVADTFEDAIDTQAEGEISAAPAAAEPAPKAAGRKKSARSKAKPKPQPEPEQHAEPEAAEAEKLEGDGEAGSAHDEAEEAAASAAPPKLERLQKILARAGIASRRHAEEMITEGRVQVNGKVVTELGSKADAARDHIRVDGKLLHGAERLRYFVLNKPRGYVTTVSDPEGRPTVMEFFAKLNERLYPVGRLDYQSEGLLLMTNDGELANQLTRAASGVEKTYLVKVSGQPGEDLIDSLREGVRIDRSKPGKGRVRTAPARIQQVRSGENPWFEVGLIEGRNRELRKMFEEIGHHVEKIRRVGYGPLVLDLEPGKMRELDPEELRLLRLAAEGKLKPKRVKASVLLPKEAGRSVNYEAGKRGGKPFRRPESGTRPLRGQDRGERQTWDRPRPPIKSQSEDRRQGRVQGGDRDRDRGGFRREGAPAFGRPEREQVRKPGWQPGRQRGEGGERPQGQLGSFSRAQGNRPGARPFRGKPGFDSEKPRFDARPPRPVGRATGAGRLGAIRPEGERPGRPARPQSGGFGGQQRSGPGRPQAGRPGQQSGGFDRQQRSGRRPQRPVRPSFKPERTTEGRSGPGHAGLDRRGPGVSRADRPRADRSGADRPFGQRPDRPGQPPRREGRGAGGRPRRNEGERPSAGGQRPNRPERGSRPSPGAGARRSGPPKPGGRGGPGRNQGPRRP